MINKFFKTIHNKYSRFFKFIFFLRYLLAIFVTAITLFLTIPIFFNYEKREDFIKNYLIDNYNFEIRKYENIKYKPFPVPRLELKNVQINLKKSDTNLDVNKFKIYPNILSIYNFNDFKASKIILYENTANLEISKSSDFIKQLLNQTKKLSINDLEIKIINNKKILLRLENIHFANFGYKKNYIKGKVFGKKFKAELGKNFKSINFSILNSGITADLELNENQNKGRKTGIFKSKILNTNFKFNFEYKNDKLKIFNSYFRSKNLSFDNESLITFQPFLEIKTKFKIEEFNFKKFKKNNFNQIIEFKDNIKKINSKNIINYKSKKFPGEYIDDFNLQLDLAYGRVFFKKNFLFVENSFKCVGSLNILEEYPLLYFDCSAIINNKKKLFKKLSIKIKNNNDILRLKVKGNLNILNKKINFDKILLNENNSSKADLKYFKNTFENILFDKSFFEIFDLKKIKNYILEII